MVHKLYALVDGGCCDDNADALVHHELLLPGHLLTMFLKVLRRSHSEASIANCIARRAEVFFEFWGVGIKPYWGTSFS